MLVSAMAEVVRAGLQAIPKGQYEGAMAVGLGYWQMMYLIVLPQALKITIPNIVNTYIGLFKDTTLVVIVGIFDFLRTVEVSRIDPKWAAPTTSATGYVFAAIFYFIFCYSMVFTRPGLASSSASVIQRERTSASALIISFTFAVISSLSRPASGMSKSSRLSSSFTAPPVTG